MWTLDFSSASYILHYIVYSGVWMVACRKIVIWFFMQMLFTEQVVGYYICYEVGFIFLNFHFSNETPDLYIWFPQCH